MAKKDIDIKKTSKLRGFKILVYHRIGPEDAPMDGLTVPRGEFFQQMDTIRRHYKPMRLGELVGRMRQGDSIDPRSLAVTFDDGYADTYEVARPILNRCSGGLIGTWSGSSSSIMPWMPRLSLLGMPPIW